MGQVYWITGLSGAGKTTIGKIFYEKLRRKYANTVFQMGICLGKYLEMIWDILTQTVESVQCAIQIYVIYYKNRESM